MLIFIEKNFQKKLNFLERYFVCYYGLNIDETPA